MRIKLVVFLGLQWGVFALGVGTLAFVLFGWITYIAVNIAVGVLFAIYLRRIAVKEIFKEISVLVTVVSLMLFMMSTFYNYLVLLNVYWQLFMINAIGVLAFFSTGLVTAFLVKLPRHVTE